MWGVEGDKIYVSFEGLFSMCNLCIYLTSFIVVCYSDRDSQGTTPNGKM